MSSPLVLLQLARRARGASPAWCLLTLSACSVADRTRPPPLDSARIELAARIERAERGRTPLEDFDAAVVDFHPSILAARTTSEAARQRERGAGAALGSRSSLASDGEMIDGSLRLDVLGIVGLGRLPCREAVAHAESMLAEARELETTKRTIAAARGLVARRNRLLAERERLLEAGLEYRQGLDRSKTLAASGFAGTALGAEAAVIESMIESRREHVGAQIEQVDLEIEIATGGAFDLSRIPSITGLELGDDVATIDAGSAALRVPLARLALDEARLRLAVAGAWPDLAVGPTFRLSPQAGLTGGMLDLDLDDPRWIRAETNAAVAERDLAASELTNSLYRLESTLLRGRRSWEAASRSLESATRAASAAARAERAAHARYFADPAHGGEWHKMAESRIGAIVSEFETRARVEEAVIRVAVDLAAPEVVR